MAVNYLFELGYGTVSDAAFMLMNNLSLLEHLPLFINGAQLISFLTMLYQQQ